MHSGSTWSSCWQPNPRRTPLGDLIGLASGWGLCQAKTTAACKWLYGKQMMLVGATGFEPVTSTV